MGQSNPARRALLICVAGEESRSLSLSDGWSSDAEALEILRLLDTQAASAQIPDLAGFFALPRGKAVLRGGVISSDPEPQRIWRELVAVDATALERVRNNPFRLLPSGPPDPTAPPKAQLTPPELPDCDADDDTRRLRALHDATHTDRAPEELETLLAAILESNHTLVTASSWGYEDIELVMLLLPVQLRPALTFHSYALSMPAAPVPRLVLTQLYDEWSFEPASGLWDHRLPGTAPEISTHARELAADLLALLDTPDRLTRAHQTYDGFARRTSLLSQSLMEEVERLLRFARMSTVRSQGEVGTALRVVAQAGAPGGAEAEAERSCQIDQLHEGFDPEAVGAAVADSIRNGAMDVATLAMVMERFMADRESDPERFSRFARPLRGVAGEYLLGSDDPATRRLLTMLLLLAAARSDATSLTAAAVVPLDGELIGRLGGVGSWSPTARPMVAAALHALAAAQSPAGVTDALAALTALRHEVEAARPKLRLAHWGVAYVRWAYRQLARERWSDGLAIGAAVVNLASAVLASSRTTLDGRADADLFKDMLERGMRAAAPDYEGHSDAELFLGFMGVEGSRSRPAAWELGERADSLARKLFDRIVADAHGGDRTAEGVHWSMALLDRVRRQEVHAQYLGMAVRLLTTSAGPDAGTLLRAYIEHYPDFARRLHEDDAARALLGVDDLAVAPAQDSEAEPVQDFEVEPVPDSEVEPPPTDLAPEEPIIILPERPANAQPWWRRMPKVARYAAVTAVSLAIVAVVALGVSGMLRGEGDGVASSDAENASLPFGGVAVESEAAAVAARRLADARVLFSAGEWGRVLEVLSVPDDAVPQSHAFAWDSLVARAALRDAERLALGNPTRLTLLQQTVYRATRGLAAVTPFAPGADLLRLVRAEACLMGPLECDPNMVAEDLVLAARSGSPEVSDRAALLMRESSSR